jgi:hypothetical protein
VEGTGIGVSSIRWASVAAVTLGVLTIGAAASHVLVDILTYQVRGDEQVTVDWITAMGLAVPAAVTGTLVAARPSSPRTCPCGSRREPEMAPKCRGG